MSGVKIPAEERDIQDVAGELPSISDQSEADLVAELEKWSARESAIRKAELCRLIAEKKRFVEQRETASSDTSTPAVDAAANVDVIAALSSIGDAVKAMGLSISRLEGRTSDIVAISTTVKRLEGQISEIIPIVPVVLKLSAVQNNFWTPSVLSSGRSSRFRRKLTKSVGDTTTAGAVCMVSGHVGTGDQVRAAHIVPCSSDASKLAFIGLTIDDVNSPRNGLFLAKNVEMAFDKLQLSFIKTKLFYDRLYLKIWDDSCRSVPIWPGHATTIGDLDGRELVLGAHKPFKRALSFQSYQAYMHCTTVGKVMPEPYGTPEAQCDARVQADAWYKAEQLRDIADQHFKNMQEELDDEASDAEEVG